MATILLDGGSDGTGRGWYRNDWHWFLGTNGKTYLRFAYPNRKPYYADAGRTADWLQDDSGWKYNGADLYYMPISGVQAEAYGLPPLPAVVPGPATTSRLGLLMHACVPSSTALCVLGIAMVAFAAGISIRL